MQVMIVKNYQELSMEAAKFILDKIHRSPTITLGLATGGTPKGTYENLVIDYKRNQTSYRDITTFNLDEYVGLDPTHYNSYRFYMDNHLFNLVDINKNNTFIPNGTTSDLEEECKRYDQLIKDKGGVDLQLLGIGKNGHIGFNEPGTSFESSTHVTQLTLSTREANARYFESIEQVPTRAITVGLGTIMQSKEILLLVAGKSKQAALARLLSRKIDDQFPASILANHPNVTIIADEAAVSKGG
jgi:glucosamine-6-phosphate deaminase